MSEFGGASDGLQKDHPDIRHLRRLYERGQCRSVGQPTEAAHRLDRHREDHPRLEHLAVFVRLLSRSALGSAITQYTSHFRGTRAGGEMHVGWSTTVGPSAWVWRSSGRRSSASAAAPE
jgi:hypothetical protein